MSGSGAAQRLWRCYLSQRDEFRLRSRFSPNEPNFSGRQPGFAKARSSRALFGPVVPNDSLMFAYVRLCSDMFA
jgi:hypothetical protein